MAKEVKIMLGIAVVVIAAGIIVLFKSGGGTTTTGLDKNDTRLVGNGAYSTGKPDAKVVLVEFGDYQCPACGYEHPILKQIAEQYKDKDFKFVFKNFPLTAIHKNAMISSEAAEAAGAQGKFWEMHDKLYENQAEWVESTNALDIFIKYARDLGLDADRFAQELRDNKYAQKIQKDMQDGNDLGVNATPTIYLNGVKFSGSPSLNDLQSRIDEELNKQ